MIHTHILNQVSDSLRHTYIVFLREFLHQKLKLNLHVESFTVVLKMKSELFINKRVLGKFFTLERTPAL